MKAYQFYAESQIGRLQDVVYNERLFCADPAKFNDKFEGEYLSDPTSGPEKGDSATPATDQAIWAGVANNQRNLRVACLTETMNSPVLWALYGSRLTGFAVEVALPEPSVNISEPVQIRKIAYDSPFDIANLNRENPHQAAVEALCHKRPDFAFEMEIRILANNQDVETSRMAKVRDASNSLYYLLAERPTKIIVGCGCSVNIREAICLVARKLSIVAALARPSRDGISLTDIPMNGNG